MNIVKFIKDTKRYIFYSRTSLVDRLSMNENGDYNLIIILVSYRLRYISYIFSLCNFPFRGAVLVKRLPVKRLLIQVTSYGFWQELKGYMFIIHNIEGLFRRQNGILCLNLLELNCKKTGIVID